MSSPEGRVKLVEKESGGRKTFFLVCNWRAPERRETLKHAVLDELCKWATFVLLLCWPQMLKWSFIKKEKGKTKNHQIDLPFFVGADFWKAFWRSKQRQKPQDMNRKIYFWPENNFQLFQYFIILFSLLFVRQRMCPEEATVHRFLRHFELASFQ